MRKLSIQYTNYNVWANDRLYHFFKDKPNDLLEQVIVSSFYSIRKTAMHMWFAENIWNQRITGVAQTSFPGFHFDGDTHKVFYELLQESIQIRDYVQSIKKSDLKKQISYNDSSSTAYSNTRFQSILHVCNHSTYHRGQLVTLARQLKFTDIPATDFIFYVRDELNN